MITSALKSETFVDLELKPRQYVRPGYPDSIESQPDAFLFLGANSSGNTISGTVYQKSHIFVQAGVSTSGKVVLSGRERPMAELVRLKEMGRPCSSWLRRAEANPVSLTTAEVYLIIKEVNIQLSKGEFEQIDDELKVANPERMSLDGVVAVARSTALAKHKLPHWEKYMDLAKITVQNRKNSLGLLRGLI